MPRIEKGDHIDIAEDPSRCGHYGNHKHDGTLCGRQVTRGTQACYRHAGVRRELHKGRGDMMTVINGLRDWGFQDQNVDPGETMLRLVTQSSWRCERYAEEVARLVAEAGTLTEALTANSYTVTEDGSPVKTGEYIRAMIQLENNERDRCMVFCKTALAAGVAERAIRLAEEEGRLMATVIRGILGDLNLTVEQLALVATVVPRHLRAIA